MLKESASYLSYQECSTVLPDTYVYMYACTEWAVKAEKLSNIKYLALVIKRIKGWEYSPF